MAMTNMTVDAYFLVEKEDENDPESPLTAYLIKPSADYGEDDAIVLGWTQTGQDPQTFLWMVECLAQFHQRRFVNDSGVKGA